MVGKCDAARYAAVAYGLLASAVYAYLVAPAIIDRLAGRGEPAWSSPALALAALAYVLSVLLALVVADAVCIDRMVSEAFEEDEPGVRRRAGEERPKEQPVFCLHRGRLPRRSGF